MGCKQAKAISQQKQFDYSTAAPYEGEMSGHVSFAESLQQRKFDTEERE